MKLWLSPALNPLLFPILVCSGFAFTLSPTHCCAMALPVLPSLVMKVEGNCLQHRRWILNSECFYSGVNMDMDTLKRTLSSSHCLWPQEQGQERSCLNTQKAVIFLLMTHGGSFIVLPPFITAYFQTVLVLCANTTYLAPCSFCALTQRNKTESHLKSYFQTAKFSFQRLSAEAGNSFLYVSAWTRIPPSLTCFQ